MPLWMEVYSGYVVLYKLKIYYHYNVINKKIYIALWLVLGENINGVTYGIELLLCVLAKKQSIVTQQ